MEARNARDEYFGDARLEHVVATSAATTPQQFVDKMISELRQWVGPETPLQDDVTLVMIDVEDTAIAKCAAGTNAAISLQNARAVPPARWPRSLQMFVGEGSPGPTLQSERT